MSLWNYRPAGVGRLFLAAYLERLCNLVHLREMSFEHSQPSLALSVQPYEVFADDVSLLPVSIHCLQKVMPNFRRHLPQLQKTTLFFGRQRLPEFFWPRAPCSRGMKSDSALPVPINADTRDRYLSDTIGNIPYPSRSVNLSSIQNAIGLEGRTIGRLDTVPSQPQHPNLRGK